MPSVKWEDGSATTALSTELNSLADAGRAISAAIDNDAGLYLYADLELVVSYATAPTAGTTAAEVYLLPTVDGTNYPEGSSTVTPQAALLVGSFEVRLGTTGPERLVLRGVDLPARDFKLLLCNKSGRAFTASGNTLKVRPYRVQSA